MHFVSIKCINTQRVLNPESVTKQPLDKHCSYCPIAQKLQASSTQADQDAEKSSSQGQSGMIEALGPVTLTSHLPSLILTSQIPKMRRNIEACLLHSAFTSIKLNNQ